MTASLTHAYQTVGVRIRFVNEAMGLETYLLGLRLFDPAPEVSDATEHVSTTLHLWVVAVLAEFSFSKDQIFAAVSDSGSDVKRCIMAPDLLNKLREWCGPHLCNRALVEAAGYSETVNGTKNPAAREVLMALNSIVHHIKKSPKTKVRGSLGRVGRGGKKLALAAGMVVMNESHLPPPTHTVLPST